MNFIMSQRLGHCMVKRAECKKFLKSQCPWVFLAEWLNEWPKGTEWLLLPAPIGKGKLQMRSFFVMELVSSACSLGKDRRHIGTWLCLRDWLIYDWWALAPLTEHIPTTSAFGYITSWSGYGRGGRKCTCHFHGPKALSQGTDSSFEHSFT